MVLFSALVIFLYFVIAVMIRFVLNDEPVQRQTVATPSVSVVVACRNEQEFLPRCLDSLVKLDYPAEKLEIIIVDDHSRDRSREVITSFVQKHGCLRLFALTRAEKQLPGKAGAVLHGIEQSSGEFIFLTDADCCVPTQWIRTHLNFFANTIGLVGGPTLLDDKKERSIRLQRFQSLDWLFLQSIASAAARLNRPLSWMGTNMAFRRCAYDQVGGYRNLGSSLVEDFSLLDTIARKSAWRICLHLQQDALVQSRAEKNLSNLYQQRKRWALGVKPVRLFGKFLMLSSTLARWTLLYMLLTLQPWSALLVSILALSDYLIVKTGAQKLHRTDLLKVLPLLEIFYLLSSLIMPVAVSVDKKIIWKEEIYQA